MLILRKVLIKLISSERVWVCEVNWLFCNFTWSTEFNLVQRTLLAKDPFVLA